MLRRNSTVFPLGFFAFTVQRVATGGATTVTLMLPPGIVANQYFKFGATPDTRSEHWYAFLFDGTTGAEILSDRVILHFVDGQRGACVVPNRCRSGAWGLNQGCTSAT